MVNTLKGNATAKPMYVTVVQQMRGRTSQKDFEKFDAAVNAKIAEGYRPHGGQTISHCSEDSMDVAQAMLLHTVNGSEAA